MTEIQLDRVFTQDPHAIYAELRETGPVREARMYRGLKVWLVTRYADARSVLADPRLSKALPSAAHLFDRHRSEDSEPFDFTTGLLGHMLNSDPPDHTRLRKLVNKAFTSRGAERLRGRIEEITEELLDKMADKDEVDLLTEYAFPLPITVICELLGVPKKDRDSFREWSTIMVSSSPPDEITAAARAVAEYFAHLIAAKRHNGGDDLITELIHASDDDDRLTEDEVMSMAFLLLVAGHETTVNLIGTGVHSLLQDPDQLAKLRADRTLLPGAVEEFLRHDGPVNLATLRFTTEPITVSDVTIPAEEFVLVALSSANRDPNRFDTPDRLDITRPTAGHLAFGHGIHYCVGAPLARLEGEIAIGALLDRYPNLSSAAEAPESLIWRDSTLMRGLETLPVRLH